MNKISGLLATSALTFVCIQGCNEPAPLVCEDPVSAVLATLDCVVQEDAVCAFNGYAPSFVKLHNGVDTETTIDIVYWAGGFAVADFAIDLEYAEFDELKSAVDIKYVETVTVDGQTFLQNEQAFVTLNGACKMTLWDQTGDVAEQEAVDDAVDAYLESIGVPPI